MNLRMADNEDAPVYSTRVVEGPDYELVEIDGVNVSFSPDTILLINDEDTVVGGIQESDMEYWVEV